MLQIAQPFATRQKEPFFAFPILVVRVVNFQSRLRYQLHTGQNHFQISASSNKALLQYFFSMSVPMFFHTGLGIFL